MLRLLTTCYSEPDPRRAAEYCSCLERNIECPAIDEIVVFNEAGRLPVASPKIQTVDLEERPTYRQFFDYINRITAAGDINIVANSDIYFDDTIRALHHVALDDTCFALSRRDVGPDGVRLFDRNDSQDCWIFRGRIKDVAADFCLGVPRCDNRLAHELEQAGYAVLNPSFSIRSYHLHSGARGEYSADNLAHFVPPPYKYIWPHNLFGISRTVIHNLRHRRSRLGYRVDWRRLKQLMRYRAWRWRRLGRGLSK